jgi:hypothetical protein
MKNTDFKEMATSKICRDLGIFSFLNVLALINVDPNSLLALFGSTLLHVLLERRGSRDGLAWVLIRVTGIKHTSSSLTRPVEDGSGAHEGSRGRCEGRGAGHEGSDNNHLGLHRRRREGVSKES